MNEMVWNAKLEQVEAMMNRAKFTLADRLNVNLMLNVEVQYEDMAQGRELNFLECVDSSTIRNFEVQL